CDVRQTILEARSHATWESVFRTLKEHGYSLIIFDNFGYRMASCSPEHYDLVGELLAYVEAQFSHGHVHVHYLDIWAFPPAMTAIFESLRTEAVSSSQPFVEPVRTRHQGDLRAAVSEQRSAIFRPSSCLTGLHQPKSSIGDDIWPDDWSHS